MGRRMKHAGLQGRFEEALRLVLDPVRPMSAGAVLLSVRGAALDLGISA